ncbi:hypothetical protein SLEP1_g28737 [Rubroshorea leprosula]|uniref:Uncharacterized protein n=1 Tax=Rubroshorea leprosula TaxID=152421 RepID=A0AAV5JUK8_9ROSI|nr:hypothetical protein SLEP1_g28737 [Rubroshorea leprosula]
MEAPSDSHGSHSLARFCSSSPFFPLQPLERKKKRNPAMPLRNR